MRPQTVATDEHLAIIQSISLRVVSVSATREFDAKRVGKLRQLLLSLVNNATGAMHLDLRQQQQLSHPVSAAL